MKEKKTLKECVESAKTKAKEWWNENKGTVIASGMSLVVSGIFLAIGEIDGKRKGRIDGWNDYAGWIIDKCGEDPMIIWEHDENGNKISMDAIATERFYDAFQHPEKVKWYEDGSFDYIEG